MNNEIPAEIVVITEQAMKYDTELSTIIIHNQQEFDHSGQLLIDVKAKTKEVEGMLKYQMEPIKEAMARLKAHFQKPLDLLAHAEVALRKARLVYSTEQEKIRAEKEQQLRELAKKEEEKKRKQIEAKAIKAEAKGDIEKAEELRKQAKDIYIPAPIVESFVQKTEGIETRKIWKYEIVDVSLLPREYLIPNEKMIGAIARSMKTLANVPGVRFYSENVEAVKTI